MNGAELYEELVERGIILNGHFELTHGLHTDVYYAKGLQDADVQLTEDLAKRLALCVEAFQPQVILTPAIGGIVLGFALAQALELTGSAAIYARKTSSGGLTLHDRLRSQLCGKRVLLADNVITTGGTLCLLASIAISSGAHIVGAATVWNRGAVPPAKAGVSRLISLLEQTATVWSSGHAMCPLCEEQVPCDPKPP